jgi:protein required for attachment to host cells
MMLTWVVIAHRSGARLLEHKGQRLRLVAELSNSAGRKKDREINSDRPGRTQDRQGQGRHAMGAEESAHDHVAFNFAREIAERLYAARNEQRFGRLVLVAEPRFLGMLRAALDHVTGAMVNATLSKDLAHVSIADLPTHLKSVVLI